jgi:hypothetical protein
MNNLRSLTIASLNILFLAFNMIGITSASERSIVGVHLGMTLDEAQVVVQESVPEIRLTELSGDVGSLWKSRIRGITYTSGIRGYTDYRSNIGASKIAIMGHAPPNEGKVSAIGRTANLEEMLLTDFRAALIEKYGNPNFETEPGELRSIGGVLISWSLTKDGKPQTSAENILACARHNNKQAQDTVGFVTGLTFPEEQFYGQYKDCGYTLVVIASQGRLPETVRAYSVILYDLNDIHKANSDTLAMAEREAKKLEEKQRKEAQGKKPQL